MPITRRSALRAGLALPSLTAAAQQTASAASSRTKPPAYRIIYNWDGAPHGYSEYRQTLAQFLDKTYAPMKNTQVDAHFWCVGEHEAKCCQGLHRCRITVEIKSHRSQSRVAP